MKGRTGGAVVASLALLTSGPVAAQSDGAVDDEREAEVILPMGRLVFTSDRGGEDLDLWMHVAGEPEPIALTAGQGLDRTPATSPEGKVVAFATDRDNPRGTTARGSDLRWYDIFLVGLDGGDPVALVANGRFNSGPSWSPDGQTIAFGGEVVGPDATSIQVHIVPVDGSAEPMALTDDPVQADGPAWSPDGTRLVFTSLRHGQNADGTWNREIYVMATDGTGQVRLTDDPASDGAPAWSPDGTRIAFHSDRAGDIDIYLMDADGSGQERLTDNPEDFPEHRGVDDFPSWGP